VRPSDGEPVAIRRPCKAVDGPGNVDEPLDRSVSRIDGDVRSRDAVVVERAEVVLPGVEHRDPGAVRGPGDGAHDGVDQPLRDHRQVRAVRRGRYQPERSEEALAVGVVFEERDA
jgi:hypothetical protein